LGVDGLCGGLLERTRNTKNISGLFIGNHPMDYCPFNVASTLDSTSNSVLDRAQQLVASFAFDMLDTYVTVT
jgi:hypothetical protein